MKNVSAAIIRKSNTVLITRRAPGKKLAGFWEFPGGKQEDNETIQQCLERELKEELDLTTNCTRILTESIYEYDRGAINLIAIDTEIIEGQISLSVHDKYEWVALENLLDYQLAPADIPVAKWIIND
jgi:8-oxo-dGTP diphosphatase